MDRDRKPGERQGGATPSHLSLVPSHVDAIVVRAIPANVVDRKEKLAIRPLSKATRRAYRSDWKNFTEWCDTYGLAKMPATEETIVLHIAYLAEEGLSVSSITRSYAAIRVVHEVRGHRLPQLLGVRDALKNLRMNGPGPNPKKALLFEQVCQVIQTLPKTLEGDFERLVLLSELAGTRRSEFARLQVEDLEIDREGMRIRIGKSKTDQEGKGRVIVIQRRKKHCLVDAMEAWLKRTGIKQGRIFPSLSRTGDFISAVVKRAARRLNLNPHEYAGHSLRRGFVTSSTRAGQNIKQIMSTTGHKSVTQVLKYMEDSGSFKDAVDMGEVSVSDFLIQGKPADAWVKRQIVQLRKAGVADDRILGALRNAGVVGDLEKVLTR